MTTPAAPRLAFGGWLLFSLLSLLELLRIFQGLDVTDTGFHLTHQIAAIAGRVEDVSPLFYLTDLVGGLWLSIRGEPSLFWARLGGVLIHGVCAALSYAILARHFAPRKVFATVLGSSLFLTSRMPLPLIHYFTLPAMLLIVGLGLLDRLLASTPDSRAFRTYACILGALPVPIFLCRLSPVPIVVPIAVLLYFLIARQPMPVALRRAVPLFALGMLISVLGMAALYASTGILDHYLAFFREISSSNTSHVAASAPGVLIKRYLAEYQSVARHTAAGCLALLAIGRVRDRMAPMTGRIVLLIAPIGAVVIATTLLAPYGLALRALTPEQIERVAMALVRSFKPFLFSLIGFTLLTSLLFFAYDRGRSQRISVLLIASNAIMVITPVGSSSGILKSCHGMWLALPLSVLVADRLRLELGKVLLASFLSAAVVLIPLQTVFGLALQSVMAYRDDWRPMLTREFRHPHLRHIRSQPDRVRVVDEVLAEIDRRTEKGDLTLMLGPLHLFYYLTETRPALGSLWLGAWTPEEISNRYREAIALGRYPAILVISELSTRSLYWPHRTLPGKRVPGESGKVELLRSQLVDELRYELTWKNEVFSIYSPPPSPGKPLEVETLTPTRRLQ